MEKIFRENEMEKIKNWEISGGINMGKLEGKIKMGKLERGK